MDINVRQAKAIFIQRYATAEEWKTKNPILYPGEIGIESNTGKIKVGREISMPWNSIDYVNSTPGETGEDGKSIFIRYSFSPDGTNYTEDWSLGQNYLGIAIGHEAPNNKEDYEWHLFASNVSEPTAITLSVDGWEDNLQIVNVPGIGSNSGVFATAHPDNLELYIQNGIFLEEASFGKATFSCTIVPTVDIKANIIIIEPVIDGDALPDFSESEDKSVLAYIDGEPRWVQINDFPELRGAAGPKGDTGEAGANGVDGADGVGITSIQKTGTVGLIDTYTIYFSNGTSTTFEITNGAQGNGEGETNNKELYIRYSAYPDGTEYTYEWSPGQNYLGLALSEGEPQSKEDYTWAQFASNIRDAATVILYPDNWTENIQKVSLATIGENSTVFAISHPDNAWEYTNYGIELVAIENRKLVFQCIATPENQIKVNVQIIEPLISEGGSGSVETIIVDTTEDLPATATDGSMAVILEFSGGNDSGINIIFADSVEELPDPSTVPEDTVALVPSVAQSVYVYDSLDAAEAANLPEGSLVAVPSTGGGGGESEGGYPVIRLNTLINEDGDTQLSEDDNKKFYFENGGQREHPFILEFYMDAGDYGEGSLAALMCAYGAGGRYRVAEPLYSGIVSFPGFNGSLIIEPTESFDNYGYRQYVAYFEFI